MSCAPQSLDDGASDLGASTSSLNLRRSNLSGKVTQLNVNAIRPEFDRSTLPPVSARYLDVLKDTLDLNARLTPRIASNSMPNLPTRAAEPTAAPAQGDSALASARRSSLHHPLVMKQGKKKKKADKGVGGGGALVNGFSESDDFMSQNTDLSEEFLEAATGFEKRHQKYMDSARELLERCPGHGSMTHSNSFDQVVQYVRRNRFFVNEKLSFNQVERKKRRQQRAAWKAEESVWAPRGAGKGGAGAYGLFETSDSMEPMFELDWSMAKNSHGLERVIAKTKAVGHIAAVQPCSSGRVVAAV